jgi:hypothetical protein
MTTERLDNLVSLTQDPEKTEDFLYECSGILRGLKVAQLEGQVIPPSFIPRLKALIDGQMLFLELHREDLLFVKDLEDIGPLCVVNR